MRKFVFILSVMFTITFVSRTPAQTQNEKPKSSVLLNSERPSVYVSFEKYGTAPPLRGGDKNERIWLRLHNNTRWELSFCSFSVAKEYGGVGLTYNVKRLQPSLGQIGFGNVEEFEEEAPPPPRGMQQPKSAETPKEPRCPPEEPKILSGYATGDTCTPFYLASGKYVVFSVPNEHLADKLYIEIDYWFEWENRHNELGRYSTLR